MRHCQSLKSLDQLRPEALYRNEVRSIKSASPCGLPGEAFCKKGLNENILIVEEKHGVDC